MIQVFDTITWREFEHRELDFWNYSNSILEYISINQSEAFQFVATGIKFTVYFWSNPLPFPKQLLHLNFRQLS